MGSERSLWNTMRDHARELQYDFERHENAVPGFPDVVGYRGGGRSCWVELKHSHSYPKREGSPVRLEHFTVEQRHWLKKRASQGFRVWVLWQIERDYYLFHGGDAAAMLGTLTREELAAIAYRFWPARMHWAELFERLFR